MVESVLEHQGSAEAWAEAALSGAPLLFAFCPGFGLKAKNSP